MLAVISVCIALVGVSVPLFLLRRFSGRLKWWDLPFVYLLVVAGVYLQLSPSASLVGRSLPGVDARAGKYVLFQVCSFLLFSVPAALLYARLRPRQRDRDRELDAPSLNSRPITLLLFGVTLLRVVIIGRYHLWHLRIGEVVAAVVVAVPTVPYSVLRLANEMVYPLLTVAVWVIANDRRHRARWIGWGALAFAAVFELLYAMLNSRYSVLLLFLALGLGFVQVRPTSRLFSRRIIRRLIVVTLLAYGLGVGVLSIRGAAPGVSQLNVLGDNQGLNRFNCADLVAQTELLTVRQNPDVAVWTGYTWTFRRFVDPAGFDKFRLSLQTTAKSRIADRFLATKQLDYYSCSATDAVAVFGPLGFLVLAAVAALLLVWSARLMVRGSPTSRMLAAWVVFHVVVFDQEFGTLLFSWPLVLPSVVVTILVARRTSFWSSRPGSSTPTQSGLARL
jgi:hypothetical protein